IPMLISFGMNEFSVSPSSVLAVRGTIAAWSKKEADALADRVMKLATEKEIYEMLKENAR
ncbi:MAG: phosphoenolpyruvate--protein phosphotransferase, partial [Coprococcus sp.]